MNPVTIFLAFIARRRASYRHAAASRRLDIITKQIADRKAAHKAWKHLVGELVACRRTMLECEIIMRDAGAFDMRGKAGA